MDLFCEGVSGYDWIEAKQMGKLESSYVCI